MVGDVQLPDFTRSLGLSVPRISIERCKRGCVYGGGGAADFPASRGAGWILTLLRIRGRRGRRWQVVCLCEKPWRRHFFHMASKGLYPRPAPVAKMENVHAPPLMSRHHNIGRLVQQPCHKASSSIGGG